MAEPTTAPATKPASSGKLVEKSWDPVTRIVGSLGIYTKIDFENKKVAECYSTSSIFRGYSIFMQNKDPRDSHFITSRICGICGDNHATCSIYAQNMAYGVKPPPLAEWIVNLGEAAEYMFDHCIYQDNLVGVDFCEMMVKETNPGVWDKATRTPCPHASEHGYKTIADIMHALNPFEGEFYRETLQMSRLTREMFCLMEGRHVHPSTLYPGGVGTVPSIQIFTDYQVRLMKYVEFMKKVVPLHDDLFDFFYEALPGYEEVGRRRILLGCWGSFQDPDVCDYNYKTMDEWGKAMFVTPGIVVDGELVTTNLVDINLGLRILLGSSFYEDWDHGETFVTHDPLGNPIDKRHPWNQTTIPKPQKRNFDKNYSWVMSPRWFDKRTGDHLALDTGGGPIARLWTTALAGLVDIGYVKAPGDKTVRIRLPKTALKPEVEFTWKIPQWSNALERDRARTYFQAYAAASALYFLEKAMKEMFAGRTATFTPFKVPDEAIGCGFHEAVRGVLSHHLVIRKGKIANYHPYPPTPWNASPRDIYGTPGPYEDAVQGMPIFEENGPDNFKGIDIMRAVRSFDPCLPCGVHMYVGPGKTIKDYTHPPPWLALPSTNIKNDNMLTIQASPDEIYDIELEHSLLEANEKLAVENRALLDRHGVTAIDFMGAIGSGKTTLITELVEMLKDKVGVAVFNGDATISTDGDAIASMGVPIVQIATINGCHLDANVVGKGLRQIDLSNLRLLLVENIGNLICPAEFPLGSKARVVVISVTEGPYMVKKHPHMFLGAAVVVINKTDLSEIMEVSVEELTRDVHTLKPDIKVIATSCKTRAGLQQVADTLLAI